MTLNFPRSLYLFTFVCLFLGGCDSSRVTPPIDQPPVENLAQPQLQAVIDFVDGARYESWERTQPIRLTGKVVDDIPYTTHQYLAVTWSQGVADWLAAGRPESGIADGSMIVALEYEEGTQAGALQRALVKVKQSDASHDGWFWASVDLTGNGKSSGSFGDSTCMSCHGAASHESSFLGDAPDMSHWSPAHAHIWTDVDQVSRQRPQPHQEADPNFLARFGLPDVTLEEVVPFPSRELDHVVRAPSLLEEPGFATSDQCVGCHNAGRRLNHTKPNMWFSLPGAPQDEPHVNYSPYGEWSASLNGLSARDPVWHAQVESERILRPQLADFTDNICFSCHGPMGPRQLQSDRGADAMFVNDMFYAHPDDEDGRYGALARDGVSCMTCHGISPDGLGVDPPVDLHDPRAWIALSDLETYSAQFRVTQPMQLFGPYPDGNRFDLIMKNGLGMDVKQGAHMDESRLCGSCHTVIVPALPVGYDGSDPLADTSLQIAYEQTTYWEWRNSWFENEQKQNGLPCQGCHMTPHGGEERIANTMSDRFPPAPGAVSAQEISLQNKKPFWRHTLMGLNLFVFEMYDQFPEILGSTRPDPTVPEETLDPFLTASDWMNYHAEYAALGLQILSADERDGLLETEVEITNYSGHKVPTGAGFRRVFVAFSVRDANDGLLWASGRSDSQGVILGSDGQALVSEFTHEPELSQPHHQVIERQDQVQIYETRALDSLGKLQTTVLGIYGEYKDNRILPLGWQTDGPNIYATHPRLPASPGAPAGVDAPEYCEDGYDPDYCEAGRTESGSDRYFYRIPLADIPNWAYVEAQIYYQTIPPYYLADRFRLGRTEQGLARDTKRLAHMASRLNLEGTRGEGWKLKLGDKVVYQRGAKAKTARVKQSTIDRVKELYPHALKK